MSTEAKWAEWHATRDQYADKQDWYDARPNPLPGSLESATAQMARLEAMSSFPNDPIGDIDRTPNLGWKNRGS